MSRKKFFIKQTFGIGYATVIMIFVLVVLAMFALLSYNASGINESLEKNNRAYISSYYSADSRYIKKLSEIDALAYEAAESGFFEESFETLLSENEITYRRTADGYKISIAEAINERLKLSATVMFFYEPQLHEGKRYIIEEYRTISTYEAEEQSLGVWDGSTPLGQQE